MSSYVRTTRAEAQEHYADLLAAIGANPQDAERWIARRDERREARRRASLSPWWRRAVRVRRAVRLAR
jgi:hypothetical protein